MGNVFDTPTAPAASIAATPPPSPPATTNVFDTPGVQPPKRAALSTAVQPRPNLLREIATEASVPVSLLSSIWQSLPGIGTPEHANHFQRAVDILRQPGKTITQRMEELNQQYGITSSATEERYGLTPGHGEHAHPWLEGGAELGAQWYNPSWAALGKNAELLGGGYKLATKTLPGLKPFTEMGGALSHAAGRMTEPFGDAASAVIGGIGKMVKAGATRLPGIPGKVVRSFVDRYAGLATRGGAVYTQAALAANAAPEHAAAEGDAFLDNLSNGLSMWQQREVQRLSSVDEYGVPEAPFINDTGHLHNVTDPAKGPTLEQRAMALRRYMMGRDRTQDLLGIAKETEEVAPSAKMLAKNPNAKPTYKSGDLYNSGRFFPMRQYGHPVYEGQEAEESQELGSVVERGGGSPSRSVRGRSKFSGTVSKAGHKENDPLLTQEDWEDIHPNYTPFYQLKEHYRRVNSAIANATFRRSLEDLPSIDPVTGIPRTDVLPGTGKQPLMARVPLYYTLLERDNPVIFGQGEAGARAMDRYIEQLAQGKAKGMAREDPAIVAQARAAGINPNLLGTRKVVNASTGPLRGRLSEAKLGTKRVSSFSSALGNRVQRLTDKEAQLQAETTAVPRPEPVPKNMDPDAAAALRARNEAGEGLHDPLLETTAKTDEALRAAKAAHQLTERSAARIAKINARFAQRALTSGTAQAFDAASTSYYKSIVDTIRQQIETEAERHMMPPHYEKEPELGISTPTSRGMALDDSWAKFFAGAPKHSFDDSADAQKFWRGMQIMNRLARLSIVLVPTVHGINNLGMAFMAEGGTPGEMLGILTKRKQWDQRLKNRAFDAGAATDWSRRTFSMGENSPLANLPPAEHARIVGERAGPLSKVASSFTRAGLETEGVYNKMNQWLFRDVEQGYAFTLFDKFTREGMTDGEAALRVRNALGRYDNISPREMSLGMNRIFYFYPWMKTVIPFWTRKGIVDPKWWGAPVAGIKALNEAQGYDDPSRPFTMTVKNLGNGEFLRATAPVPQRVLEVVADLARLPVDVASKQSAGDTFQQDVAPVGRYVLGHLNPLLNIGVQGTTALAVGTDKVPPYNDFRTDPNLSTLENMPAIAGKMAGSVLAPIERSETFSTDPIGTIGSFLAGSFMYEQKDQTRKQRESIISHEVDGYMAHAIHDAKLGKDPDLLRRLELLRKQIVARSIQALDRGQAAPPLPPGSTVQGGNLMVPPPGPAAAPVASPGSGNVFDQAPPP